MTMYCAKCQLIKQQWVETPGKILTLTLIKSQTGGHNMPKIGEFAKSYEPIAKTKNISDLAEVSTDLEILDDEFEFEDKVTKQTKTVKQKIVTIAGENYRVPVSVLQQLNVILEDNPQLKKFKVRKTGEGKDSTRYLVIPLG